MKKNIIILIIFYFVSSCGYNSLYKNNDPKDHKFNFKIAETSGDKTINSNISSELKKYGDGSSKKLFEIKINSTFSKSTTSRDKKGKASSYTIVVTTDFYLINNNAETQKITIFETIGIKNNSDAFQQKNYELKIKKDISRSISQQFVEQLYTLK